MLPGTTPRSLSTPTVSVLTLTGARSKDVLPVLGCQPSHKRHPETPAFAEQETFLEISCNDQHLRPYISAKIGKGFFYFLDWKWTCYRRNYFSVLCSYSLNPHIPNGSMYVNRSGKPEQIRALAMSLLAVVGNHGKTIELVQHTPERNKSSQMQIRKEKLAPIPLGKAQRGPHSYTLSKIASLYLPLQSEHDPVAVHRRFSPSSHNTKTCQYTFEQI